MYIKVTDPIEHKRDSFSLNATHASRTLCLQFFQMTSLMQGIYTFQWKLLQIQCL